MDPEESEEIAAAQLHAQRTCRMEIELWALKYNHDLMVEIALDTFIGRKLDGLVLKEVRNAVHHAHHAHRPDTDMLCLDFGNLAGTKGRRKVGAPTPVQLRRIATVKRPDLNLSIVCYHWGLILWPFG